MKVNRIRKIEELLMDMHSLSIDYLCEYFNVSKNTIRRDIAEMDKNGSIKKSLWRYCPKRYQGT